MKRPFFGSDFLRNTTVENQAFIAYCVKLGWVKLPREKILPLPVHEHLWNSNGLCSYLGCNALRPDPATIAAPAPADRV